MEKVYVLLLKIDIASTPAPVILEVPGVYRTREKAEVALEQKTRQLAIELLEESSNMWQVDLETATTEELGELVKEIELREYDGYTLGGATVPYYILKEIELQ